MHVPKIFKKDPRINSALSNVIVNSIRYIYAYIPIYIIYVFMYMRMKIFGKIIRVSCHSLQFVVHLCTFLLLLFALLLPPLGLLRTHYTFEEQEMVLWLSFDFGKWQREMNLIRILTRQIFTIAKKHFFKDLRWEISTPESSFQTYCAQISPRVPLAV